VIDRAGRPDIRARTDDAISTARRDYDRLSGSAAVMSDIPPSERVRDAWGARTATAPRSRAVLHRVIINPIPPGLPDSPGGKLKDPAIRRDREMAILRQRAGFGWRG